VLLTVAVVLAVAGAGASATAAVSWPAAPTRAAAADRATTTAPTVPGPTLGRSAPVRLDIPAIGVSTSLLTLGLQPDGTVAVPPLESPEAGWYEHSPTPGEAGPAILLGHVDSARSGPGVFHDLPALRPGDRVDVLRADGGTAAFAVERVERYPKDAFPTGAVYGDLPGPGLRLITCGGAFDRTTGHYVDNVVVYAGAVAAGQVR
jgi:hypothetical protein